ncbi:hypothetical protein [Acrocarpospora catenulata]|uniref:hypothetical protein n=1 Tax=Acrocarpospora catenulata TaxID=2836182 RepID=UPI001BDA9D9F|nr:hypothetical protein [Acrocarpospora catenulata]
MEHGREVAYYKEALCRPQLSVGIVQAAAIAATASAAGTFGGRSPASAALPGGGFGFESELTGRTPRWHPHHDAAARVLRAALAYFQNMKEREVEQAQGTVLGRDVSLIMHDLDVVAEVGDSTATACVG